MFEAIGVLLHDLFNLLLGVLGPVVLALCVAGGLAFGSYVWSRSRGRREHVREVASYADALKDTTAALRSSTETLQQTQRRLNELNVTNLELSALVNKLKVELDQERQGNQESITALTTKITQLQAEVTRLQAEVTRLQGLLAGSEAARVAAEARLQAELDRRTRAADREGVDPHLTDVLTTGEGSEPARDKATTDDESVQEA